MNSIGQNESLKGNVMSLFAGVIAMDAGAQVPHHTEQVLKSKLSRRDQEKVRLYQGPRHQIAHAELGLLPGHGYFEDGEGRLSLLSGDPLLSETFNVGYAANSRLEALKRLHEAWLLGNDSLLSITRGDFCSVHFDQNTMAVRLCADRLGLRPLYHARAEGCLIFATSLRMMLLLMPRLSSCPDLYGQLQVITFGYTLGERTVFEGVYLLRPAHVLDVVHGTGQAKPYFDWYDCPPAAAVVEDLLERLQQVFTEGIHLRLNGQNAVIAQLSGGLDSRCVVAGLREQGVEVHSINFSPPGSADLVLGEAASQALGTRHFAVTDGPVNIQARSASAHERLLIHLGHDNGIDQPFVIWSGFGGDSVLSEPEMSSDLAAALESGDASRVVTLYLGLLKIAFPSRIFQPSLRARLSSFLEECLLQSFVRTDKGSLVRAFNVFRMTEQLRGPLRKRYEEQDLERLEYIKPLCDPDLVACALNIPLHITFRHKLYYRWLETFKLPVARIPWQAYPNSDPCPIPLPEGLRNQWAGGWFSLGELADQRKKELARYADELRSPFFPTNTLSRKNLLFALALGRLGVHRQRYLLHAAMPIIGFSSMSARARAGTLV